MITLDELAAIRERARAQMEVRVTSEPSTYIVVGTSEDGMAAGAHAVLKRTVSEVAHRELQHSVRVIADGNIDMPGSAPVLEIRTPGRERSVFTQVKPDDVPRILAEGLEFDA